MLYACLHSLHMQEFTTSVTPEELSVLQDINENASSEIPEELYCEETRSGKRGVNAMRWIQFADLIELYFLFDRAVRENDIDLFSYTLYEMISIFFLTNHCNYARWMSHYSLELQNLAKLKPDFKSVAKNGGFTVRRSNQSFFQSSG